MLDERAFIFNPAAGNWQHGLCERSVAPRGARDKVLEPLILIQGSTTPVSFPEAA